MNREEYNELTHKIIGAAIEVHTLLGPGLLESAYRIALMQELNLRGIRAEDEVEIPVFYKGVRLDTGYRADIIVEDKIILELKATEKDNPLYSRQLYTYLKLTDKRVGLLMNFNRAQLLEGLERVVHKF